MKKIVAKILILVVMTKRKFQHLTKTTMVDLKKEKSQKLTSLARLEKEVVRNLKEIRKISRSHRLKSDLRYYHNLLQ